MTGVDVTLARQALTAVPAACRVRHHATRYRRVADHLREQSDALTSGASTTPVDVARLIAHQRRLGHPQVADPRCADCDRPCFPRHNRPDGVRICTVLLFGQRPHRISRLTTSQVNVEDHRVAIMLGTSPIELPDHLAVHVRTLVATRRARTAKHVTTQGRGCSLASTLAVPPCPRPSPTGCSGSVQPTAHRTAALLQLAGELPPAILGDLLGLGRTAVQEWSNLAGRPWASYIGDRIHRQTPAAVG